MPSLFYWFLALHKNKMQKKIFIFPVLIIVTIFLVRTISAHCPLCTVGAGAAAAGALWLGVKEIVVALFIGAFAMSMGLWFSRIIKKKYIPHQKTAIVTIVFLTTVLPILAIIMKNEHGFYPLYISLFGDYGSFFNRTYLISKPLLSSLFGGLLVFISPIASRKISNFRKGKIIPFQGVILTLLVLIVAGGLIQVLV